MIDLAKYTGGALSTGDYIAMAKYRDRSKWYYPDCPLEKKLWNIIERKQKIERDYTYPITEELLRTLDDYGFTTGIY